VVDFLQAGVLPSLPTVDLKQIQSPPAKHIIADVNADPPCKEMSHRMVGF